MASWLPATLFLGYQAGDSLTQSAPIPKLPLAGAWGTVSWIAVAIAPSLPNAPTQGLWGLAGEEVAGGKAGLQGVLHLEQGHRPKDPSLDFLF